MDFLTVFQKTVLALAIVFSILTLAMVFYTLMHRSNYRSTFVKVLFTIITPMITFIMWFACLFAGLEVLGSNELYIFLISIVCGAALMGIAYGGAYLIHYLMKKKNPEIDEAEVDQEEVEEIEDEQEEAEGEQEEAEDEQEDVEAEADQDEQTADAETSQNEANDNQ